MVKTSNKSCLSLFAKKTDVKRYVLNDSAHWLLIQLIQPVLTATKEIFNEREIIKTFNVQLKIFNSSKLYDQLVLNYNVKQPNKCQIHNEMPVLQRT